MEKKDPVSGNRNNPIYSLLSTWILQSQRHFMNKVHKGLFFTNSNEVIWPPKNSTFMHAWVKKCHFGNFSEIG